MNDLDKSDNRVISYTLLFALSLVIATYLSGPENNYWLAPGAVMYMILLLSVAIPKWWVFSDDRDFKKNFIVVGAMFGIPSVVLGALGISTSKNVYTYWQSIMVPLYIGHMLKERGFPGYGILSTFSAPLLLMIAMSVSINPLPHVNIKGSSPANNV